MQVLIVTLFIVLSLLVTIIRWCCVLICWNKLQIYYKAVIFFVNKSNGKRKKVCFTLNKNLKPYKH